MGTCNTRLSKFEEYDLYMQNKNFLMSERVITFSDIDGKLMALKPDITLSIVKNAKDDGCTEKVYYTENVYRVRGTHTDFEKFRKPGWNTSARLTHTLWRKC